MKKLLYSIEISLLLCVASCSTTAQRTAFNSLDSVEQLTTTTYSGYMIEVAKGNVRTNEVPVISKAFNHYQRSAKVALDAVQFNKNALAPSSLVVESQDLIDLINGLTNKH